jgi:hypothetical protein
MAIAGDTSLASAVVRVAGRDAAACRLRPRRRSPCDAATADPTCWLELAFTTPAFSSYAHLDAQGNDLVLMSTGM